MNEMIFIPHIGVDESGKGDFFGPLIVAGVCVTNETKKYFIDLGIKDSKKLSDRDILELAGQIKSKSVFSVITINPLKYNELYLKLNNLNRLLAWGHARAIENVLDKYPCEYAISDKFADESLIQKALMKQGQKIVLEQKIKAESDIAVAAASVVARACFVQKIEEMSYKYNMTFPKGASHNVKEAGKFFVSKFGKENLKYVAKLHFKTTLEL